MELWATWCSWRCLYLCRHELENYGKLDWSKCLFQLNPSFISLITLIKERTHTLQLIISLSRKKERKEISGSFQVENFFSAMPVWAACKVAASWKVPKLQSGLNNLKLDIPFYWNMIRRCFLPPTTFHLSAFVVKRLFPLLSFNIKTVWKGNEFWSKKLCALVSGDKEQFFFTSSCSYWGRMLRLFLSVRCGF